MLAHIGTSSHACCAVYDCATVRLAYAGHWHRVESYLAFPLGTVAATLDWHDARHGRLSCGELQPYFNSILDAARPVARQPISALFLLECGERSLRAWEAAKSTITAAIGSTCESASSQQLRTSAAQSELNRLAYKWVRAYNKRAPGLYPAIFSMWVREYADQDSPEYQQANRHYWDVRRAGLARTHRHGPY